MGACGRAGGWVEGVRTGGLRVVWRVYRRRLSAHREPRRLSFRQEEEGGNTGREFNGRAAKKGPAAAADSSSSDDDDESDDDDTEGGHGNSKGQGA